jgi:hypothetical protein
MRRIGLFAGIMLAPASLAANGTAVSYERDIQPIFDENCVACHQTGSAEQGLVFEGGKSFDNIVRVPSKEAKLLLVSPGNPDQSYLLVKLAGTQAKAGGHGAQMPLGDPLSAAKIALVSNWIAAGAPRN